MSVERWFECDECGQIAPLYESVEDVDGTERCQRCHAGRELARLRELCWEAFETLSELAPFYPGGLVDRLRLAAHRSPEERHDER